MLSLPDLKAVIFDLDDTLYPEHAYVRSGFRAVADWCEIHLGLSSKGAFEVLDDLFLRGVRGDTFDLLLERFAKPAHHVADMVRVYRDHTPSIETYPGVPSFLSQVGSRYRTGLITDGYAEVQRKKLTALALAPFFDAVVFSDDLGRSFWKPAPEPFRRALSLLGVEPAEAVYIGDNPAKDFVGARGAGLATIQVRWPGAEYSGRPPPSAEHAPDRAVGDIGDLVRILLP